MNLASTTRKKMNKLTISKVSMFQTVVATLHENQTAVDSKPAFASALQSFETRLAELEQLLNDQAKDLKWIANEKESTREKAIEKVYVLVKMIRAYSVSIGDENLQANLASKEGLQGVAEMPHKVYNMEAGLREGRDKPRELEIGSGHWTATSTTAKKGHAMDMYVAGLESRKKTNDSSLEYFGASSAPHQFYNDHTMEHREECRRKGNEGAPMYLGNANYVDQSGNGDLHRSAQNSRPLNHRSFNEKYMDGTENTFFGAATSMVQSAFVHFFGGDVVHTKKEEMVFGRIITTIAQHLKKIFWTPNHQQDCHTIEAS